MVVCLFTAVILTVQCNLQEAGSSHVADTRILFMGKSDFQYHSDTGDAKI